MSFDAPWKEAIREYFRDFCEFFFPAIARDIDWSCGFMFLIKSCFNSIPREKSADVRQIYLSKSVVAAAIQALF